MKIIQLVVICCLLPLSIFSQSYVGLLNQGAKEYNEGKYDKAIQTLKNAKQDVEDQIGNNNAYYFYIVNILAQCYQEADLYQEAEKPLLEAYQVLKSNPYLDKDKSLTGYTYNNLSKNYYFLGNYSESIKIGEEALSLLKDSKHEKIPEIHFTIAASFKELGKYESSEKYFQTVLSLVPNSDKLYFKSQEGLAINQFKQGKYYEAENKLLSISQQTAEKLGKNNLTYANQLINLGQASHQLQKFYDAKKYLQETLKILENLGKTQSKDYALACSYLADVLLDLGELNSAENYLNQAMKIYQTQNDIVNIALTYNQLASSYEFKGNINLAEETYKKGLQLAKDFQNQDYSIYGTISLNLAELLAKNNNIKKADSLFQVSLKVYEKVHGQNSLYYQEGIMNYAAFKFNIGDYSFALQQFPKSLNYFEKNLGKLSKQYINCLTNFATLYSTQEDFSKSEKYFSEALALTEKLTGKKSFYYITILNNYSQFYTKLGNHEQATYILNNAFELGKSFLEPNSIYFAIAISNIGVAYLNMGKMEQARTYINISQDVLQKNFYSEHPQYLINLNNLAFTYFIEQNYLQAQTIYEKILPIAEKNLGKTHPTYWNIVNNLSVIYAEIKKFSQAEPLLIQLRNNAEKLYGKNHSDYLLFSTNLAYLYTRQNNFSQAHKIYQEVLPSIFWQIQNVFPLLSEKEKLAFVQEKRKLIQSYLNFALNFAKSIPNIASEVLELRMMQRGLVTENTQNFKSKVLNSKDPEIQNLYQQWLSAKDQYLKVVLMKEEDKRFYDLSTLNNQVNSLEKQLQQKLNIQYSKPQKITFKQIQQKLKPNEAAIEIIRTLFTNENLKIDTSYSFIIITQNCTNPEILSINGNALENHVYQYYFRQVVDRKNVDKKSYPILWKNIINQSQLLKNYELKKVYLTCDGVYHKIPLSTLFIPEENQFLGDKIEIVNLLNLKHILNPSNSTPKTASLFGYPDYKGKDNLPNNLPEEQLPLPTEQRNIMFRLLDFSEQGVSLLPGTKKETDEIHQLLQKQQIQTQLFQSAQATEEMVKKLQSPNILHIATHGYFIEDEHLNTYDNIKEDKLKIFYEDPLMRAGLLLANCENDLLKNKIYKNQEDGVLTAYEASQLNLQNTDLVVLSACQTGLGDAKNEEGVFGLQRAFFLAGAKSLMLSLWSVDDEATQEFMIVFYDAWINQKMSKRKAFLVAQQKIKSQERFASPYFWGAFVLIGE